MKSPTWVELHGAMTHFPIALIFVVILVDLLSLTTRQEEVQRGWQRAALLLLALATLSFVPSLLSGYFAGQDMRRLPTTFDAHWKAAVIAGICCAFTLTWRLAARDRLGVPARTSAMLVVTLGAGAVAYTGYLGGEMVFGDTTEYVPVAQATPSPAAASNTAGKLEVAAGKMEVAAGKLDLAAARLAMASGASPAATPAAPAPAKGAATKTTPVAPGKKITPATPAPKGVAEPPSDAAVASRLEKVAGRYEKVADKLGKAADKIAVNPGKSSGGKGTSAPSGNAVPTAQAPTTADNGDKDAARDAALVAAGLKVYANEELGCIGCHKINGKGGRTGPALDGTGTRFPDVDWHFRHIRSPKSEVPGSTMPGYTRGDINDEDLRALSAYMASLK